MDINVPYMPSVKNLAAILDAAQRAAVPEAFSYEFLRDLGFTSSNDRSIIKVFKYIGLLDQSGRPQSSYKEFVDHTKSKAVLARRLKAAYDDLYLSHQKAHENTVDALKGWFRSKTGKGDAVALKMASTFKSLATYADFSKVNADLSKNPDEGKTPQEQSAPPTPKPDVDDAKKGLLSSGVGLVYRLEIHLPDTQNLDTYRAIFKALREELG